MPYRCFKKKRARSPSVNPAADGTPKFIWLLQVLYVRRISVFPPEMQRILCADGKLLLQTEPPVVPCALLMDQAYEGNETRKNSIKDATK